MFLEASGAVQRKIHLFLHFVFDDKCLLFWYCPMSFLNLRIFGAMIRIVYLQIVQDFCRANLFLFLFLPAGR